LSDDNIFLKDRIDKFLNKDNFEEFEINFLIKYFSQISSNHIMLDINNFSEYKIFKFLTTKKKKVFPKIILSTH
jgi:hypothetical protein